MNERTRPQSESLPPRTAGQLSSALLQRKCACGGSAGLAGTCGKCQEHRLLGKPVQTKLRVNEPGDEYEQEADRVAEQVMRMPGEAVRPDTSPSGEASLARRTAPGSRAAGRVTAPSIVQHLLSSPGQPLDAASRAFFEPRFGYDFSRVRVHADAAAADSARWVNALAYTAGQDVVFGSGRYEPGSRAGRQLLAHELAHVVQQGKAPAMAPAVAADGVDSAVSTSRRQTDRWIQRQPEAEPPTFPDFPRFAEALELNVGKNLRDYGHHLYQASILHPDEPHYLESALTRYALGLNVLKTSYRFAGLGEGAADKLAVGTGILFKGLNFVRDGEFTFDFQVNLGKGLKFEANLDLGVNPDKHTEVRKAQLGLGLVGEF